MRIAAVFLFLFSISLSAVAQNDSVSDRRFWTAGFNLGMIGFSPAPQHNYSGNDFFQRTTNYGIGFVQDNNGKRHFAVTANTSVGVNAGIMLRDKNKKNYTNIEADFQMNKGCYEYRFPFSYTFNGDSNSAWVMTDKYFKYSLSVQRSFYRGISPRTGNDSWIYIRESFGQTFDHRNFSDRLRQGSFENWVNNEGNGMIATTVMLNPMSFMISSEIGIRSFNTDNNSTFDMGIVWHQPFVPTYTDQYEFFRDHSTSGLGQITYSGATVMLNIRYTFDKPMKIRQHSPVMNTNGPVADNNTKHHPQLDSLDDRRMDVQSTMVAKRSVIKLKVWDRDEIDGDSITISVNGQIVRQHISLKRRKKTIRIHLKPGKNYIVMYAENLGSIPPNTAAVEVIDGHSRRMVTLVSDKGKSGAIEVDTGK